MPSSVIIEGVGRGQVLNAIVEAYPSGQRTTSQVKRTNFTYFPAVESRLL